MSSPPGYDALLAGTALVRRTDRGVVRLRGADRVTWLQGLVTNDIAALAAGHRVYSAYLTPQGRMITDLWIVPAGDVLLLDLPATLSTALAARLDALIFAEDVQIDDATDSMAVLQVFGAAAAEAADKAAADGADDADSQAGVIERRCSRVRRALACRLRSRPGGRAFLATLPSRTSRWGSTRSRCFGWRRACRDFSST